MLRKNKSTIGFLEVYIIIGCIGALIKMLIIPLFAMTILAIMLNHIFGDT